MLRKLLHRVRRLERSDRWLLLETTCHLLAAQWVLRVLPFAWLTWWFQRPARLPELAGSERKAMIERIRMAIYLTNAWLGLHMVCFSGSMAAQAMLRRRGISTTLCYGAVSLPEQGGLTTHVWLQDGAEGVVGHEDISQFQILARYSPLTVQRISK